MITEIDSSFENISGLLWRPFIGDNFGMTQYRILFIGESHNVDPEGLDFVKMNKDFTRVIVDRMGIKEDKPSKFFINLNKMFVTKNTENFWEKICFYNFIQRPMVTNKDKPNTNDFRIGWNIFYEVINIIKPTICIFLGTSAANFFNNYCVGNMKIYEPIIWHDRINGAYFKKGLINCDNRDIELIFIKHPSMAFKVEQWTNLLQERYSPIINYLRY